MSLLIFALATLSAFHTVSSFPFTAATATPQSHHELLQFIENQHLTNIHNLQYRNVTELYVRVLELSQTLNILQESLVCNLYTYCTCNITIMFVYYHRVTGLVMMLLWYLLTVSFQREQQMIVLVMWRYIYTNTHKATIALPHTHNHEWSHT